MSDLIKYEYIKILDELEQVSVVFDELQEKTKQLKKQYALTPNDENLLMAIKAHEENYRQVYEKFVELNERSKVLKMQSDAENK